VCSYFLGKYLLSCNAGPRAYMPSDFEMREYCRSSRYKICPFYVRSAFTAGATAGPKGTFTRPGAERGKDAIEDLSHLR
jgi:hypothetical protein